MGLSCIEVFFVGGRQGSGTWRHWVLKVVVKWLSTDCLKNLPAAEPYARANLPVSIYRGSWLNSGQGVFCWTLNLADFPLLQLPKYATWRLRIENTFCYTVPVSEFLELLWAEISKHNPDFISYDSTAKLTYLLHPTELIFIIEKGTYKSYTHRFALLYHSH